MSCYSTFDFGYQIGKIDDHYLETGSTNFIQKILEKKPTCQIRYPNNEITCPSNVSLGSHLELNRCPLCQSNLRYLDNWGIKRLVEKQHHKWCYPRKLDNDSLYQHILEKSKNCWLHHMLLKYIEAMYPDTKKKKNV